ncbi:uncharacterized protein [Paramisgurnus dabryanus]|uniref:uncharacterized protein n=1 Tax=Paramisgurnus dabryanus TaxID=90735 RepID=UPI0031F433BE
MLKLEDFEDVNPDRFISCGDQIDQIHLCSSIMDQTQTSTHEDFSPGCSSDHQKSSDPEISCVSMKSDRSMNPPINFKNESTSPAVSSDHQKRSDPEFSCVSMKSHRSMNPPWHFTNESTSPAVSSDHQKRSDSEFSCVSMKSDRSMGEPLNFKSEETRPAHRRIGTESDCQRRKIEQSENQLQDFNENMSPRLTNSLTSQRTRTQDYKNRNIYNADAEEGLHSETYNKDRQRLRHTSAKYTNKHSHESNLAKVLSRFRSNLRKKFECLYELTSNKRNPTLLNEIYTELYITESESGEISNEHEVRQIETQSRRTTTEETPIKCNDIFKPLPEQDKHIRSVLTKGVAGIGKTVSVQKFILDWAEEKENQDVHLIFSLPFREINLMKHKTLRALF